MKKIFTIILFSVFVLAMGCKKTEEVKPELQSKLSLTGTWELREQRGMQISGSPGILPSGNGNILKFSDKNYQQLNGGLVVSSGTYMITKESSWTNSDDRLIYDTDKNLKRFISVNNNKLTLFVAAPIAADGWELVYERIQDPAN